MSCNESKHRNDRGDGFSVLMSLYHKESPLYLDECFESLFNQTLPATEIVLVIDGPIDDALEDVVTKWKNKLPLNVYPLKENVGLGRALNYGLEQCQYDMVARMDTDDLCVSTRFAQQVSIMKELPELAILGSAIREVEAESLETISHRRVPLSMSHIRSAVPKKNPFNHMTVIYSKRVIQSVGGYKHLPFMEDWYLWSRVIANGYNGMNVDDCLVDARTGREMILRRAGWIYIKSEWEMTVNKVKLGLVGWIPALLIFVQRATPRVMPKLILSLIYRFSRR